MKILILSSSDPYRVAGIVALDLYNGLKSIEGNEVKMVVKDWDRYPDKNIIPIDTKIEADSRKLLTRLRREFDKFCIKQKRFNVNAEPKVKTNPDYYILQDDQTITHFETQRILKRANFKPEVIIVLFMTSFLSFRNLYELSKLTNAPVFLYLMDMAAFTGGCHYAWNCIGFIKECGNCPAYYSKDQYDQSYVNYIFKNKYIEKTNIFPIAGSEWQLRQLERSSLFKGKRKFKLLLSIDETKYSPAEKNKVRQELNLPVHKKIIFFGAVSATERRKGLKELIQALNFLYQIIVDPCSIHLAIAGNKSNSFKDLLPFSYTILGHLDHNFLYKAFQAADIFVSPSIEDSGPMMINQSIMCGTPVVSFEIGVALDLVKNRETGYKAKLKDSNDMAEGIKYILELNNEDYKEMSSECRKIGIRLCHPKERTNTMMDILNNQI